jgi:hypothetical protein
VRPYKGYKRSRYYRNLVQKLCAWRIIMEDMCQEGRGMREGEKFY